jgi:aromatic ring-opening dioxygenase LigB subunit
MVNIEKIRQEFTWGSYGKDGKEYKSILLKDIKDDHLNNIINHINIYSSQYDSIILEIMLLEKEYRQLQLRNKKIKKIYGNIQSQ